MPNTYVFNKGKAPIVRGSLLPPIQSECYEVLSDEEVRQAKLAGLPLIYEGDTEFRPLFMTNIPTR